VGHHAAKWQDDNKTLGMFAKTKSTARRRYRQFGGSVLCFLAVRDLGITATELARQMGLTQPAISMSVKWGEGIMREKKLSVDVFLS
jgi:DNA-binding transcriptional regulator GbsR (MarR family)